MTSGRAGASSAVVARLRSAPNASSAAYSLGTRAGSRSRHVLKVTTPTWPARPTAARGATRSGIGKSLACHPPQALPRTRAAVTPVATPAARSRRTFRVRGESVLAVIMLSLGRDDRTGRRGLPPDEQEIA